MEKHAIHYQLIPFDPYAHLFAVELTIYAPDPQGQIVSLPTWIPGSYMIRDFSKHLINLKAETLAGDELNVESMDKARWRVAASDQPIVLSYLVYAWDLSVRGAHFDQTHAFFNGTGTFLMVEGQRNQTVTVDLEATDFTDHQAWSLATTLPAVNVDAQGFGRYSAPNYDVLIDHPVEMGTFTEVRFMAANVEHRVILTGKHDCDLERLTQDLAKICSTQINFFGQPAPFSQYLFMVMVVGEGYGGLEHCDSTALVCSRNSLPYKGMTKASDEYLVFLELCSHEYFHAWNVKRILPAQFQTPDLSQAVYTEQLWWFEGATSVYDLLFLYLANIIDRNTYLDRLAKQVTSVYRMPGRFQQTVSESSFHAWTKLYQQDENAPNAIISYYSKGALIALGLDFTIRSATQDEKNLDDLLLRLWQEYGQTGRGLEEGEIERLASEIAGVDLTDYFDYYLRGTADLPFEKWFAHYGIQFKLRAPESPSDSGGQIKSANNSQNKYLSLGANLVNTEHQTVRITHAWHQRPAHLSGLSAHDEIIAINGLKISSISALEQRLARQQPNDRLVCQFFRRDELMETTLVLDQPPADRVMITSLESTDHSYPREMNE